TATGLLQPSKEPEGGERRRERGQQPTNRANGSRVGTQAKTTSPLSIKGLWSNRATGPQGHCFLQVPAKALLQPPKEPEGGERRRERGQQPTNRANGARLGTQAPTPSPLSIKELWSNRATGPQGQCFLPVHQVQSRAKTRVLAFGGFPGIELLR